MYVPTCLRCEQPDDSDDDDRVALSLSELFFPQHATHEGQPTNKRPDGAYAQGLSGGYSSRQRMRALSGEKNVLVFRWLAVCARKVRVNPVK